MTVSSKVVTALVDALHGPARATTALSILSRPKYPMRELRPHVMPDGSVTVSLAKWGYQYKCRGPRPKSPPPTNTEAIRAALAAALPHDLAVTAVVDCGDGVSITIKKDVFL